MATEDKETRSMTSDGPPDPTRGTAFDLIAHKPRETGYALLAAGAIFAALPLWLALHYRAEYAVVAVASALAPLVLLAAGLWQLLRVPGQVSEPAAARLLVLVVGGFFGLCLVLVAASLAYQWWDSLVGGLKTWKGKEGWRVWACVVTLLVGLVVLFASLQLGRTQERTNPVLRRLLYGYNAVLTGLLVLAILVFVNVLAAMHLDSTYDWTTQSIYSLSSRSESILQALARPTKVYVILARGGETGAKLFYKVEALMNNCRAVNDKLQVEYLSPDMDRDRIAQLREKYHFGDREGLLVVYGTEPRAESQFIRAQALQGDTGRGFQSGREARFFTGESELMTALNFLEEGKEKPVIYFTQGNGEPELNDVATEEIGQGLGVLKQRLESDNYTVRGLRLGKKLPGADSRSPDLVVAEEVPDNAGVLVIAGPRRMPADAVNAIKRYMERAGEEKKQGRLIVMLDPPQPGSKDLEPLQNYLESSLGVQVGNNRVLEVRLVLDRVLKDPRWLFATVNAGLRETNPIATAFRRRLLWFFDTRTVQPASGPGPKQYRAETLLQIRVDEDAWAETDLRTPPMDFLTSEQKAKEVPAKLSNVPLSVAVVVTKDNKPSAVVFGTSSFFTNALVRVGEQVGNPYSFFLSTLGWLREKPGDIGIEPKKQDNYELNTADVSRSRMVFVPALLMLVAVIGLGTGVWVVRRR